MSLSLPTKRKNQQKEKINKKKKSEAIIFLNSNFGDKTKINIWVLTSLNQPIKLIT